MDMKAIEKLLEAVKQIVVNYKESEYCLYYDKESDKTVHLLGFGNEFMFFATMLKNLVREGHKEEVKAIVNSILYEEGEDDD